MVFTPTILGSGIGGYAFLSRTRESQQAVFEQNQDLTRQTERFTSRLPDILTSDQLLDDRAMLAVALGAFGLEDDINNRAFIKQVLDADLNDPSSLPNRLSDTRYLDLAEAFNFGGQGGPRLSETKTGDELSQDLRDLTSAEELLGNRNLLRAALQKYGLEGDAGNTFFLQSVLESDLADPESFANRLSDPRYVELSAAFGFGEDIKNQGDIFGFATLMADRLGDLETADDLLDDPDLLRTSLDMFGLGADVDRRDFLKDILESDLVEDTSFAGDQEDQRYAAFSQAFGFGQALRAAGNDRDLLEPPVDTPLTKLIEEVQERDGRPETSKAFFEDFGLMIDVLGFFGIPPGTDALNRARRVVESDRNDPISAFNAVSDQRFIALADALTFEPETTERVYPTGFADEIVGNFLDRQFEIQVGNQDQDMRLALVFERDLGLILDRGSGNDTRWFAIMGSPPLRAVFEAALNLPSSFGTLDVDKQLEILKDRSERNFGTSDVAELAEPDRLERIRDRFLSASALNGFGTGTGQTNVALTLLSQNF